MAVNIVDSGFGEAEVGDHNTWTFRCDEFNSNEVNINQAVFFTTISSIEQEDGTSLFSCNVCHQSSKDVDEIVLHLQTDHGEEETLPVSNGNVVVDKIQIEQNILDEPDEPSTSNVGENIHLNTQFMKTLKESFLRNIVPTLSEKSRVAFNQNQNLSDDPKKFKAVRKEITESLVDHCIDKFGFEKPSLAGWLFLPAKIKKDRPVV